MKAELLSLTNPEQLAEKEAELARAEEQRRRAEEEKKEKEREKRTNHVLKVAARRYPVGKTNRWDEEYRSNGH